MGWHSYMEAEWLVSNYHGNFDVYIEFLYKIMISLPCRNSSCILREPSLLQENLFEILHFVSPRCQKTVDCI